MEIIVFILFFVLLLAAYGWVLAKNDLHRFKEYYFNNCDLEVLPKIYEKSNNYKMTGDYQRLTRNKERIRFGAAELYSGVTVITDKYLPGKKVTLVTFFKEAPETYIVEVTYEDI